MKKITIYLLVVLLAFTYACNNSSATKDEAVEVGGEDTAVMAKADSIPIVSADPVARASSAQPEEEPTYDQDSLDFERYQVADEKIAKRAPIDWADYSGAKDFKTRITEAYNTGEIDFAGYYVTSVFGCGASCLMGFMVDVRDGKIYDLPLGEENSCLFAEDRAVHKLKSRLFISGICKEKMEDKKVYYIAYLWNEDKKDFEKIDAAAFLKK